MNINPIYIQEVSKEYYNKILDNSRQHKAAARLTKKWKEYDDPLKVRRREKIDKFGDIVIKIHRRYDKARGRNPLDTSTRNMYIDNLLKVNKKYPPNISSLDKEWNSEWKDDVYKNLRAVRKIDNHEKRMKKRRHPDHPWPRLNDIKLAHFDLDRKHW